MDTTNAVEALQAFARYAKRIEDESGGAYMPQILLYGDGSGKVFDPADETVYLRRFGDLTELLAWLKGQNA